MAINGNTGRIKVEVILWGLLLLLASASLIFYGLQASLARGLWFDEALTTFFISQSWGGLFSLLMSFEANMALYYGFLKVWSTIADSEAGLRLFSLLAFGGATAILASGVRRYAGFRAALATAVLVTSHFFLIRYSVEVRGYALAMLGVAAIWYCWLRGVMEGKASWWWAYTAVGAITLHFHFFIALAVFTLGMVVILLYPKRIGYTRWLMHHVVIGCSFLPIALFTFFQEKGQLDWIEPPGFRALLDTAFMYSGASPQAPEWARHVLLLGFAALVGIGTLAAILRRRTTQSAVGHPLLVSVIAVSTVPVVLVFLVSQVQPIFSARFFVPFVPFFLAWTILVLEPALRYWLLALVTGILVLFTISSAAYSDRGVVSWKEVNRKMLAECSGESGALFMTPNAQAPFLFYRNALAEDQAPGCNWTIYPYKMTADNYLRQANDYPTDLQDLQRLDEMWVYIAHSGEAETTRLTQYWRDVEDTFDTCARAAGNEALQLYHCD